MMAFMSPRLWLALGLAAVLAFTHVLANRAGAARVRGQWDAAIAQQLQQSMAAEQENRRIESARQSKVIEAQNANTKRFQASQAAVARRDADSLGLRDDLAVIRADVSSATLDACRARAATLAAVLADMELEGGRMAAHAQGHANDALTFEQAWPK